MSAMVPKTAWIVYGRNGNQRWQCRRYSSKHAALRYADKATAEHGWRGNVYEVELVQVGFERSEK